MIDIHSHILPGIDDGSRSFEESIEIIRELVSYSITDIIATPHYIDETNYISSPKNNQKLLKDLKERLDLEGININLYLGNEIYINDHIVELFKEKKITSLNGSKYVLVEIPLNDEFPNYIDYFKELIDCGYQVILAHPERYSIVQENYDVVDKLIDSGVLLQCNLGSIIGKYDKKAKKVVKKLIRENKVFAFGSDIHHGGRGAYVKKALKILSKYYDEKSLQKVLVKNPKKIIA